MKKLNDSKRTYMLITIPILALFVCFNTIPLIRGVFGGSISLRCANPR